MAQATGLPFEPLVRVKLIAAHAGFPAGTVGTLIEITTVPGATGWQVTVRVPDDLRGNFDLKLLSSEVEAA